MMPLDSVPPIAPGDSLVLAEGAKHLMVSGLRRRIAPGDTLPIVVTLRDGRVLPANAVVRTP
jgi:copper(I)-binding protein